MDVKGLSDNGGVTSIVTTDSAHDITVLRVATAGAALRLAQTEPRIGERIAVIGSPLGLQSTVSDGIVL
jgi:S1-C subfamily serine protease